MSRTPSSTHSHSKSGGSPSRSTHRPQSSSARERSRDQESETDTSSISEGIPPQSITHMRDNLQNIIEMMGEKDCECTTANTDSATSGSVQNENMAANCMSSATDCNVEGRSRTSYGECRCCGKQTSSESGEVCLCNSVQPEVHKKVTSPRICNSKITRRYNECIDTPQISSEDTIRASSQLNQCIDRNAIRNTGIPPCYLQNERQHCATNGKRQYRGYNNCEEVPVRYLKPDDTSSEECPCEEPCPGKQNAKKKLKNFFNKVVGIKESIHAQHELYKFRLKDQDPNFKLPRHLIFDLVEGIPKDPHGEKQKPKKPSDKIRRDMEDYDNKVDIYYFDHGNSGYYRTTDQPPPLMADFFIEQTDLYATRFWAEIFGTIHIGVAFATTFFLQFFRFLFYTLLRPVTVGLIQLSSDYFFKPLLSITFNGIIQPILILLYNIATSFRDLCEPIAHGLGFFLREIAGVFRSVRLIEINKIKTENTTHGNV